MLLLLANRFTSLAVKQLRSIKQRHCVIRQPCSHFSSSVLVDHDKSSGDDDGHDGSVVVHSKDAFGGSNYQWEDPFRLRSQLNEEEIAVWDAGHAFCQGELMPGIVGANRHEIPCNKDMMKKMGT